MLPKLVAPCQPWRSPQMEREVSLTVDEKQALLYSTGQERPARVDREAALVEIVRQPSVMYRTCASSFWSWIVFVMARKERLVKFTSSQEIKNKLVRRAYEHCQLLLKLREVLVILLPVGGRALRFVRGRKHFFRFHHSSFALH